STTRPTRPTTGSCSTALAQHPEPIRGTSAWVCATRSDASRTAVLAERAPSRAPVFFALVESRPELLDDHRRLDPFPAPFRHALAAPRACTAARVPARGARRPGGPRRLGGPLPAPVGADPDPHVLLRREPAAPSEQPAPPPGLGGARLSRPG